MLYTAVLSESGACRQFYYRLQSLLVCLPAPLWLSFIYVAVTRWGFCFPMGVGNSSSVRGLLFWFCMWGKENKPFIIKLMLSLLVVRQRDLPQPMMWPGAVLTMVSQGQRRFRGVCAASCCHGGWPPWRWSTSRVAVLSIWKKKTKTYRNKASPLWHLRLVSYCCNLDLSKLAPTANPVWQAACTPDSRFWWPRWAA